MHKRVDFYRWLGLSPSASPHQVDERRQGLLKWLRGKDMPQDLRPWAQEQAALVEELYETFSDQIEETGEPEEVPTLTLTGPRPGWRARLRGPVGFTALGILAAVVILGGIAWGQGRLGGGQASTPPPTPDTGIMPAVQQQIAQLEAIVAQEPGNADALFQLGEIYVQAQQWEQAITYFRRLLIVQPDNAHAQTDIGIAHMELSRYIEAEAALFKALESDPNYVHAHYTLGFVYAFGSPADPEAARQHWQEVVNLVPGTELAQVVQVHLDQLSEEPPSR